MGFTDGKNETGIIQDLIASKKKSLSGRDMNKNGRIFSGQGTGWIDVASKLWSMVLCPGGGWWRVVSLRALCCDLWCSLDVYYHHQWHEQWNQVHPWQVCQWHQTEWCSQERYHPGGPVQVWKVGPKNPPEVQQVWMQGGAPGL